MIKTPPVELEFSRKYDRSHSEQYLKKHHEGWARRLSHWRDEQVARLAGRDHGPGDEDARLRTVHAFYDAALEAGASPDGPPGPRPHYGEPYYGCFVRDLDGHKIEAAYWDAELVYELYIEPHEH